MVKVQGVRVLAVPGNGFYCHGFIHRNSQYNPKREEHKKIILKANEFLQVNNRSKEKGHVENNVLKNKHWIADTK